MHKKRFALFVSLGLFLICLSSCSKPPAEFVTWKEVVRLNDDRTIVVSQKKFCDGGPHTGGKHAYCVDREAWLTIDLPEFSSTPMVWHEHLSPMIVNIDHGKLYVVGTPATQREYRLYGEPEPLYVGFVWESGQWKKIQFKEIPVSIYDANMLIDSIPPKDTVLLSLEEKNSSVLNGRSELRATREVLRVDPNYKSNYPPLFKPKPAQ